MPEIAKLKNCRRFTSYEKGQKPLADMLRASKDTDFIFTHNTFNFLFCKDIDYFIDNWNWVMNAYEPVCELVRFEGKIPLYMDIEWLWSNENDITPLESFGWLFRKFIHPAGCDEYDKSPMEFLMDNFAITKGTRLVEKNNKYQYKHSYHLIWRTGYYFKTQLDIRYFLDEFESFSLNNLDKDVMIHRQNILVSEKSIVDYSVYNKKVGTCQAIRIPYSIKTDMRESRLVPISFFTNIKSHFVSWVSEDDKLRLVKPPLNKVRKEIDNRKRSKEVCVVDNGFCDIIPERITNRAKSLMNREHSNGGEFVGSRVLESGDYSFNFRDTITSCKICKKAHSSNSDSHYTHSVIYKPNTNTYCYSCASYNLEHPNRKQLIELKNSMDNNRWDLILPKTNRCPNFPEIKNDFIEDGGTYFCESAKGTGKSEAINRLIASRPKTDKICMISFRINLCDKIHSETKAFGITHYRQPDFDPNRCVICLNSLHRLAQKGLKYDYIIIDEIFSVMESFSSSLLEKSLAGVLAFFKKIIGEANKVYLLDAHLRCDMINEPFSCLRDSGKFVYHKNPNGHNYDDYTVYYDEYNPKNEKVKYENYVNKLVGFLTDGKKLAVMCSSKSISECIAKLCESKFKWTITKEIKLYNAESDELEKKKDFANTQEAWANPDVKVIIYSPTVSAGISYNDGSLTGVDILMCFGNLGNQFASFNTFKQMTHRCRQLLGKEIYILMNKEVCGKPMTKWQIEKELTMNLENVDLVVKNQAFYGYGELDEDCRPVYDTNSWSYKLIIEIMRETYHYYSLDNIKEGLIREFTNRPEDDEAGRGMKFVDLTLVKSKAKSTGKENKDIMDSNKEFDESNILQMWFDTWHITYDTWDKLRLAQIKGDAITTKEKFQYTRWLKMRTYNIDSKKLITASRNRDEEDYDLDIDSAVKELIEYKPEKTVIFRKQNHWKRKYTKDDSYEKALTQVSDKLLWNETYDKEDLDQLRKSIQDKGVSDAVLIKNLHDKGLNDCQRIVDLLELFQMTDLSYTDLHNIKLDKSSFQLPKKPYTKHQSSLMLKVIQDLHGDRQWFLNQHKDNIRWIQKYYNTGKEFLDIDYSDLATDDTFHTKQLEEWKEEKYLKKQAYSQKKKDSFKKAILNDTWSCKGVKCLRPELYELMDFVKLLGKAVEKIGYKITSVKSKNKQAVKEWVIEDIFTGLSVIQTYEGQKLTKLATELNNEILATKNRHLDMGVEKI